MELLRPNEVIQRNNNANNNENQQNNNNNNQNNNPNNIPNNIPNNNQNHNPQNNVPDPNPQNNIPNPNINLNNLNPNNLNPNNFHHVIHANEDQFLLNEKYTKSLYEIFSTLIFTRNFHKVSIALIIFMSSWICYLIYISNYNIYSIITKLESNESYFSIIIWIVISIILMISWNFYLFIYTTIFKYNYEKFSTNNIRTSFVEECYKNPLVFNFLMFYYNNNFLSNSIDNCFWLLIGIEYCFLNYHLNQFFQKVNAELKNFKSVNVSQSTRKVIPKFSIILIGHGLTIKIFNYLIIQDLSFTEQFLLLARGFYFIYKIIEFWKVSKDEFDFADFNMELKEKYFMRNLKTKTIIEIGGILYVYMQIIITFLYGDCTPFYLNIIVICSMIILGLQLVLYYKKYKEIRDYFHCLDISLQKIILNNEKDEECVICTEKITLARKLPCNHYFHLICLSKWFEKGHNSCPICRNAIHFGGNIDKIIFNRNLGNGQQNNRGGVFSFSFNLNNLLSWLPNFSLRIIRFNNNNVNLNMNNGGNIVIQNPGNGQINLNIRRRNININIGPGQNNIQNIQRINIIPQQGNVINNFGFINNNVNNINNMNNDINNANNINNMNNNMNNANNINNINAAVA